MNNPLEKAWCLRLIHEFEQICYSRSLSLQCPNFEISKSASSAGQWNSGTKTINISSRLIGQHSWDVVIEVLKHEMAHQYVSEILTGDDSSTHGAQFKEVCALIGVHPPFINSSGKLPKILKDEHFKSLKKNKYLSKIEKLLALAESAAEHEAASAMEKANRLISKYNLEIVMGATESQYDYIQRKIGKKRVHSWTKSIIAIVRDFFFVKAIYLNQYDHESDEEFRAVEFLGRPENLAIADHVFNFLHDRLDILWREYRKNKTVLTKDKRSYCLGVLYGFREKLEISDKKITGVQFDHDESTSALVVASDKELNRLFTIRYPKTRSRSTGTMSVGADAFNSGMEKGRRLNIYKPIEKKTEYNRLKLT